MSIVNPQAMLKKAYQNKYAILHANVVNPQMTRTIIETCQKTNSPIIIAVSQKALKQYTSPKDFATSVRMIVQDLKITVPVAIHLDHGEYETVLEAIKSGFTSVMFDGSKLPLKENLQKTKNIVKLAKRYKVAVEAEVGTVTGKDEDNGASGQLATVEECLRLAKTGINFLAAGIGNLHGNYPSNWKGLNFERLWEINRSLKWIPLVLHGGSGIPSDQLHQAIKLGVAKINVGTEFLIAFSEALKLYFNNKPTDKHWYDPRNYFPLGLQNIDKIVIEKLKFLGSFNKA